MVDGLSAQYSIETPENVSFSYAVAGVGHRFIAALLDSALLFGALLLLNLVVLALLAVAGGMYPADALETGQESSVAEGLVLALFALVNFLIYWGYFIVFELVWNGQTPGKRFARIRIVQADGSPVRPVAVLVRNLVRVIDFMPLGYGVGLLSMLFTRHEQRLGDLAAGTLAVKERGRVALEELAGPRRAVTAPAADGLAARYPSIGRLTPAEIELVEAALRRHDQGAVAPALLHRVAGLVASRSGAAPPGALWTEDRRFLEDALAAYYARTRSSPSHP